MTDQSNTVELLDKAYSLLSQFESSTSCDDNLPSPITIFKIGGILYESKKRKSSTIIPTEDDFEYLADAFHQLLFNVNRDYLRRVIFHDINSAFVTTVGSLLCSNQISWFQGNNIQIISSSIHTLCGIYDALLIRDRLDQCLMEYAFDTRVCNTLIKCYDSLIESDRNDNIDENNIDELKTCIFSALSSLLLHGLIYPWSMNNKSNKYPTFNEDESIQNIMEVIQNLTDNSCTLSFCLGDLLSWQENLHRHQEKQQQQQNENKSVNYSQYPNIITVIRSLFTNEVITQKEYLISVLQSAPTSIIQHNEEFQSHIEQNNIRKSSNSQNNNPEQINQNKHANQRTQSALDRLIHQVQTIFPHLGEGYIEAALACYNHNIEETTIALMECETNPSSLHPRLRVLDKSLPARRKETKNKYDIGHSNDDNGVDKEDKEAIEVQKERIKLMVAAQEDEAYKLGVAMAMDDAEYNDDYDDQYDGVGDGVGGADAGLYDVDFESIKTYNRLAKEVEADKAFWEENRNLNRQMRNGGGNGTANRNNNDEDDDNDNSEADSDQNDGKKYYGPDKGKGGRIIGPDGKYLPHPKSRKKGGKVNNSNQSKDLGSSTNNSTDTKDNTADKKKNSDQMSKIQKRRKNDNKAKIGNHHRKDRALKKTGM